MKHDSNVWYICIYCIFCCFKNHICKEKYWKLSFLFVVNCHILSLWAEIRKKVQLLRRNQKLLFASNRLLNSAFLKRFSYKSNGARVQSFISSVTFIFSLLCLCHIVTSIPVFLDGRQINCQKLQSGFSDFKKLGSVKYVMHFEGERSIKVYCRALSVRIGIIGVLKENLFDCS